MSQIRLRRAAREDVPAIVALLADDVLGAARDRVEHSLPAAYQKAFDQIDAEPSNLLAVAEDASGAVVGTLQLTFIPGLSNRGARRCLIEGVRVASALRGGGVGARMIDWALDEARARGCTSAQLLTHASRVDAQRFYARLGFEPTHVGMKRAL